MGNVRMRAEQINYGASNVKAALDDLDPKDLIALSERMDTIEAWKATVKAEEKTGAEVTFTNALALNAVSLSAEIEAEQDLHGYDKPWVGGAGKNLYGGTLSTIFDFPRILATGTVISISLDKTGEGNVTMNLYKANETTRYDFFTLSGTGRVSRTVTLVRDTARVMFYADSGVTAENIQIEVGSSATSYAPYSNICPISGRTAVTITDYDSESNTATVTVQLGQTVYGGTLNATTGVMTVTWVGIADASSLNTWTKSVSNYGSFKCTVSDAIKVADAQKLVISSCYNGVSKNGASAGADNYIYTPNNTTIIIKDTAKNSLTAEEFAATLSGQQICYELATPQTIQLTPTQLTMLKGYNRLSSDGGGDITVEAYTGAAWGGDEA